MNPAQIPEQFVPYREGERIVAPVSADASHISFAPTTYVSKAEYTAEAFAPVASLGETATKFIGYAKPVEGTFVNASAADMQGAAAYFHQSNTLSPYERDMLKLSETDENSRSRAKTAEELVSA